jgi:peptide/nickel transport system permease protein
MLLFAARRLLILAATLAFASLIIFAALEILPGNAAQTILGASATPDSVAALAHKLGLDRPAPVRYLAWIGGALGGDLGNSYAYNSPIAPLIGERLAVTLPLTIMAMAIASAVALTAGVYAAERRGKAGDVAVMAMSQFGLAIPNFWFGIMLVLVFAVHWRLFPSGGFPGWEDPLKALKALLLPALALGLVQAAILTRVTRSALVEALGEDFMRTARAKGLSARAALWRHALPNAAPPILTIAGLQFSLLIAGAVVVENVFTLPGLGRLIAQSIANRDVLVVEDCVMGLAALVILVNAAVDIAAAAIDPRLRAA